MVPKTFVFFKIQAVIGYLPTQFPEALQQVLKSILAIVGEKRQRQKIFRYDFLQKLIRCSPFKAYRI